MSETVSIFMYCKLPDTNRTKECDPHNNPVALERKKSEHGQQWLLPDPIGGEELGQCGIYGSYEVHLFMIAERRGRNEKGCTIHGKRERGKFTMCNVQCAMCNVQFANNFNRNSQISNTQISSNTQFANKKEKFLVPWEGVEPS